MPEIEVNRPTRKRVPRRLNQVISAWAGAWFENLPETETHEVTVDITDAGEPCIEVLTPFGEHRITAATACEEIDRLVALAWNDGYKHGDDDGFREGKLHR